MQFKPFIAMLPAVFAFAHAGANAQVKVGVSLSATGPAASLGIAHDILWPGLTHRPLAGEGVDISGFGGRRL